MYGPGTEFAKNMCWKCILGIVWRYLWITCFTKTRSSRKLFFRLFIPSDNRGWSSLDMGCSWLTPLRWTFSYLDGAHKLQVYPSGALGQGRGWELGAWKADRREESGGSAVPRAAELVFILHIRLSNGKSFENEFHSLTRRNLGIHWARWLYKHSSLKHSYSFHLTVSSR